MRLPHFVGEYMLRLPLMAGACVALFLTNSRFIPSSAADTWQQRASFVEHDSTVAAPQPGPHDGGGTTTAYSFFARAPDLHLVFRKRALHPGAAIGYHRQTEDEVYYILSGVGELTLNGARSVVGPGTAILTRTASSHGLRQMGSADLVLIIAYQQ